MTRTTSSQGEVLIVDEKPPARIILPGRRYNEGLHQAIGAKEAWRSRPRADLAAITLQDYYFRMYDKLAGMTSTARDQGRRVHEYTYKLGVRRSRPTSR